VSADPCGGGGGRDYAAAHVFDWQSWDLVASYHGRAEPLDFADQLEAVGYLYNEATLAPEANTHGAGVISVLRDRRYPNIYRMSDRTKTKSHSSTQLGFMTSVKTRAEALGYLKDAVKDRNLGIRDGETLKEMGYFIVSDSGKEEAEQGQNDDRVMSCAIAAYILTSSWKPKLRKERQPRKKAAVPILSPTAGW
jgi:hypothetical protein